MSSFHSPLYFKASAQMDTDNPQLVTFLQGIRPQLPLEIQPKIDDLIVYYQKKYKKLLNNVILIFS